MRLTIPPATEARTIEDDRVTVVVMSRNRREELLKTLARHRAPVVLVDNGSTDGTVDAVQAAFADVDVVSLARNEGAVARTIGVRHARTAFVAFADDDSWWAPGALRAAADVLDGDGRLALVNGRILMGPENRTDPFDALAASSPVERPEGVDRPVLTGFMACAAMVRRDAFLAVGGFDPVVRFPGEEERVALDLLGAGWVLGYAGEAIIHHHPSTRRHDPVAREVAVLRSRLLTAVMRLPLRTVLGTVGPLLRRRAGRRALMAALPDLAPALRARRPVPSPVLRTLDQARARPQLHREASHGGRPSRPTGQEPDLTAP